MNGGMASGWVGILSAELHFPEAHSLKEKRMYVRSAKEQLRNRFGAAVAEVDHHEVWQRARLTVAVVTREAGEADRLLADATRRYAGNAAWPPVSFGPRLAGVSNPIHETATSVPSSEMAPPIALRP